MTKQMNQSPIPAQPRVAALLACGHNLMPLSWHMPVSKQPFRYAFAIRQENHSHTLLQQSGSCTLNFMGIEHYETIDRLGRFHGDAYDKLAISELARRGTDEDGNLLLDAAEFIYECRLIEQNCWGDHSIFVCDVARIRLHENPTGRLALFSGKGRYMSTGEVYQAQKALL